MNKMLSAKTITSHYIKWLIPLLASTALLSAYAIEYFFGVYPCILCQFQRVVIWGVLVFWIFQYIMSSSKYLRIAWDFVIVATILIGVVFSARHWMIQMNPQSVQSFACPPNLWHLFKVQTFVDAMMTVFLAGSECAKVDVSFLLLPLSAWVLVLFLSLLLLHIISIRSRQV